MGNIGFGAMDVGAWLARYGLGDYAESFAENGVDRALLAELTNEDLKDLGVTRLADRRRLLKAIAALAEDTGSSETEVSPVMAPAGEYRQVTVLFADLSAFTQLSNELGAEETHALLERYFAVVDGVVEGYGGAVDKHIGDAVMAVFGAPLAHTNDPERAAMVALDIHRAVAALDRGLKVHIGIASGRVVASGGGAHGRREFTVTGDSVNLASRLTDLAGASETLISDAVRRAISRHFVGTSLGPQKLKGLKQPVTVWRLESLRAEAHGHIQAFVGRRRELRHIQGAIDDCLETGLGQSIYIRGEAGIGKTRLVEEVERLAEVKGFETHTGLILDFGVGKGQDAVRALVRSLLGLPLGCGKARRQAAAGQAVADRLVMPSEQVHLNDLLDLEQPAELKSLHAAMDNATRTRGAQDTLAGLVRSRSKDTALLLKIEDVHWANKAVLSQLSRLAATVAEVPALLLMTSRIEGHQLDQAWRSTTGGAPITTIDLGPMRDAEALEFAQDFPNISNDFAAACVARAGGNPLFLEQLLRSTEEAAEGSVPGSIQSIVQARMDGLPAGDRTALQAASVLGQRFSLDALRHLLSDPDYRPDGIVSHHLVRPLAEVFLFSHALIREGAYASLLKAQRQSLHERTASWYAERDAVLHAEHLDKAGSPAAAGAYLVAGRSLSDQNRHDRAAELAGKGLACAADPASRHALLCLQGEALREVGDVEASTDAFTAAVSERVDDLAACQSWIGLAHGQRLAERYAEAVAALQKAETFAAGSDTAKELAQIHYHHASIAFRAGDLEGCLRHSKQALREAQRAASPEDEARAFSVLGDAHYMRGQMVTAYANFDRCVALSRAHDFGRIEVANLHMRGLTRYFQLDLKGALREGARSAEMAARTGQHRAEMIALGMQGGIHLDMADLDDAQEAFEKALSKARFLGAKSYEPFSFASLAKIKHAKGRPQEALELARLAVAVSREVGLKTSGPRALGALALITDDAEERQAALREGQELLEQGCISHHYFSFYRDAMESSLLHRAPHELLRYAGLLEAYTRPEPSPLIDFFIARGRALAAWVRGAADDGTRRALSRLRHEADQSGLRTALPALGAALSDPLR